MSDFDYASKEGATFTITITYYEEPTYSPTEEPTYPPTEEPTYPPTEEPTEEPTEVSTEAPTEEPTTIPPCLEIKGISNYCPSVYSTVWDEDVSKETTLVFRAIESVDINSFSFSLQYDSEKLELVDASFFTDDMLINSDSDEYNLSGNVTNLIEPYHVNKGATLASFTFHVYDIGRTDVRFQVLDMNIHTAYDNQARVSDGVLQSVCFHKSVRVTKGYPADCLNTGLTDYVYCFDCRKAVVTQETIPAKGHTSAIDKEIPPTCTETGLTEGSHCSVCGEILKAQEEIPALGHKPVIDPYLAPTCQHEGHTLGSHCENCGEIYVAYDVIPKLPHTIVTDEAVAPSCGKTGLTEGSHCSVCGEVIVAQKVVPALSHEYEMVPAVPATYLKDGATEGVRCRHCGEWLIEPQIIPKLPIDFIYGDADGNGRVDVRDVTAIQRHLADINTLTGKLLGAADTNGDGVVNITDATHLQKYLAEFDGIVLGKQPTA